MRVMWKFPFDVAPRFSVQMPAVHRVCAVQLQGGVPCMWVLVDHASAVETVWFRVVGTGHQFDLDGLGFVGTFQQAPFVWHLFEEVA
jgi:hypothetical protein